MVLYELTEHEENILKFISTVPDRPTTAEEIEAGLLDMTPEQIGNALGIMEARGMFQHPKGQIFYSPRRNPITLLPSIREQYNS